MAQTLTNRPVSVHDYLKGEQASEIRHEYVLIAQDLMRVEIYRRANEWELEIYEQGDRIRLDTVQLELRIVKSRPNKAIAGKSPKVIRVWVRFD